jgi:3-phenylpropionate/trans-cinnamate dioxygenase ferredoxin reductase component
VERTPYREGIVYYLRAGRVRGVLLWNVWEKVEIARDIIVAHASFTTGELDAAILLDGRRSKAS